MKKLFKVALVAGCLFFAGNIAEAQSKIGHINFNQLIDQMPDTKTIQKQIQDYSKTFSDQLTAMQTELTTNAQAYDAKRASMTDAARTAKEAELQDQNKRLQDFNTKAQQQVNDKTNQLSKPLLDKARSAVQAVAKEKGYTYVFDTAQTELLVSPEADNLMAAVKAKLGLK
ncbi:OmpH family outer membrane protein [Mucilaginibacter arboris]|uniref:OmpH family outer membrane protein n=1 Tax=Mucilaginibacter arboris TaxID=2682090 RepID=A0A7K1SUH4_9SPHI|nr:OmpH family outer membrane protein [Mucilaginibacter arboris]MVN20917.1 OmpH family outer membrane protein [Mucilaginibacter arboris]